MLVALVVGAVIGFIVEVVLIRPLYRHHIQQVLVTVGLPRQCCCSTRHPGVLTPARWRSRSGWRARRCSSEPVPNDRFLFIAVALAVFLGLQALLHYTRLGLIIRAGVENRTMVEALGINVHRTFTIVFALGGLAAALAGLLYSQYAGTVSPAQGGSLLIYAFIVVVIGGMGSLVGTAVAAVAVGLVQQLANFRGERRWRPVRRAAARPGPPAPPHVNEGSPRMRTAVSLKALPAIIVLAVPATCHTFPSRCPASSRRVNGPGSLQLLATCLVIAGIALSYDVIFGRTGLAQLRARPLRRRWELSAHDLAVRLGASPRGRPCVAGRHDCCSRSSSAASHCGSVASPSPW